MDLGVPPGNDPLDRTDRAPAPEFVPSDRPTAESPDFVVRGIVDGRPAVARWHDGHLIADPELVRRAEIVVALGESFVTDDDPDIVVTASLDHGGSAALLTVIRAFSRVTTVELARG